MMSNVEYGRGSNAKGIHFYQIIQLRELQNQELMIPRNFVERYWKDVPNPISVKFPNESECKMNWVQRGDDIWLLNWKRFARSLRCEDLLVFQYNGGSDFHVIVFDDSKLEIDYSSMRCNDDQDSNKHCKQEAKESDDGDDDCVEIPNDRENTKQPLKKKKNNSNGIATTAVTPHETNIEKRKINIHATQHKVLESNGKFCRGGSVKKAKKCTKTKDRNKRSWSKSHPDENCSFTLKLSRYYVEGDRLRIPTWFSKEYMKELLQGNATIRSVGEDRTWHVTLMLEARNGCFTMRTGWSSFAQKHNLQVGDVCKFELTQCKPLSFTVTIISATKEPCPKQFQDDQGVQEKSETTPVEDMENVGNFEEGITNSCTKTHDSVSPTNLHEMFKVFITSLDKLVLLPSELLKRHNIFSGNSVELKVEEGSWFVEVCYNEYIDYGWFTKGWQEFVRECYVKIGDTCLFEMIDVQNHVFKVSIILDA